MDSAEKKTGYRNIQLSGGVASFPGAREVCSISGSLPDDPGGITCMHTFVSPSAFSRRAVVSYWRKYVHEVLVNRLGGLSLPRKSVVRLTDRPDMTLDVYCGRKTTMQHYKMIIILEITVDWEIYITV